MKAIRVQNQSNLTVCESESRVRNKVKRVLEANVSPGSSLFTLHMRFAMSLDLCDYNCHFRVLETHSLSMFDEALTVKITVTLLYSRNKHIHTPIQETFDITFLTPKVMQ